MQGPRPLLVAAALALAVVLLAAGRADAGKPKRYYFELVEVKAGAGVTVDDATVAAIHAQVEKVLATHPQLTGTLVKPPAPDASFTAWKKYLGKQKLAGAYRVNLEVTDYEETLEDQDPGDKIALRLTIRLSLRMFGEVIPMRTIAFTGDGSSTVKADIGRKLRPRDREFDVGSAIELAVADALTTSLHRLETAPPPAKK